MRPNNAAELNKKAKTIVENIFFNIRPFQLIKVFHLNQSISYIAKQGIIYIYKRESDKKRNKKEGELMKKITKVVCVIACTNYCALSFAKSAVQMQQLYKKIGSELIVIRKEFTAAQPKVYSLLDQVEKLYAVSKNVHQKKVQYKKLYKTKDLEVVKLKKELSLAKSEVQTTRSQLDFTHKRLEAEKANVSAVIKEKNDFINKVSKLDLQVQAQGKKKMAKSDKLDEKLDLDGIDLGQSLNLTSTSAPTSPR